MVYINGINASKYSSPMEYPGNCPFQAVTFLSPDRWRSPTTFPKGHVFTIPKRSPSQNYQAVIFVFIKNGSKGGFFQPAIFVIDDTGGQMDKFVIFRSVGTNVGNKILDLLEQMLGYIYIYGYMMNT